MKMGERFAKQIENGNNPLLGFITENKKLKLIELTREDFYKKYEIDVVNDTHKCVVPMLKKI